MSSLLRRSLSVTFTLGNARRNSCITRGTSETNGPVGVTPTQIRPRSPTHVFCTLLQSMLGISTGRVAYRGGAEAMNDLMSGQVDFSCISLSGAISQIKGGTLKAIAIASPRRADVIPNVPTTAEGGLPQFVVSTWNGIFAPKNLAPEVQDKLNHALATALDDATVRKRLTDIGSSSRTLPSARRMPSRTWSPPRCLDGAESSPHPWRAETRHASKTRACEPTNVRFGSHLVTFERPRAGLRPAGKTPGGSRSQRRMNRYPRRAVARESSSRGTIAA
jgi:hypothetical protein